MTEIEPVQVKHDNGYKNIWGLNRYFYRQEGKKLTIKGKWTLSFLTLIFIITCVMSLLKSVGIEDRTPITFREVVNTTPTINIPESEKQSNIEAKSKHIFIHKVHYFGGLEVVNRPNFNQIPPGIIVRAKLASGASNGLVKATLTEPVYVNGEAVITSGTILIGNGTSTEERLMVDFTKLVFSDGKVQNIKAKACDIQDQTLGIQGSKIGKYTSRLAAGIGLNFVAGLTEGLQESEVSNGVVIRKSNFKNAVLNGTTKASLEQSKEIIDQWKQQKTVIQVKNNTDICIIFDGD